MIMLSNSHRKNPLSDFNKFKFCDGLMYHDRLLYILEGLVRLQVLQGKHDTLVAGHFGFKNTMELVSRDYWWLQLWKFMKELWAHVMFVLM
jgi:hypothetical protein